jgi:hypothetical protein
MYYIKKKYEPWGGANAPSPLVSHELFLVLNTQVYF